MARSLLCKALAAALIPVTMVLAQPVPDDTVNIINNASFEDEAVKEMKPVEHDSKALKHWRIKNESNSDIYLVTNEEMKPGDGEQFVVIHPSLKTPMLSQQVATTKDQRYVLIFKAACVPWPVSGAGKLKSGSTAVIRVLVDQVGGGAGDVPISISNSKDFSQARPEWISKAVAFRAKSDKTTISFYAVDAPDPMLAIALDTIDMHAFPFFDYVPTEIPIKR